MPFPVLFSSTFTSFWCAAPLELIQTCCRRGDARRRLTVRVAGCLSAPARGAARPLQVLRQLLLERAGDVDVVVDLVDEIDGQRVLNGRIGDQIRARLPPVVVVEHLAVDPERQDHDDPEDRGNDDQRPDADAPAPAQATCGSSGHEDVLAITNGTLAFGGTGRIIPSV